MVSVTKFSSVLGAVLTATGLALFATPTIANESAPAPPVSAPPVSAPPVSAPPVSAPPVSAPPVSTPVPAPSASEPFAFSHIDDYSPAECTGQVSYTTDASEVEKRITALTQNFESAVETILADTDLVSCTAVTGTLSDTTQNINYIHETKGVYKVMTELEPTSANTEDYIYTFDILGVRYIPYDSDNQLDMAGSTMLPAIGGTCVTDDTNYPFEVDCTFAIAGEDNSALSIGKLHYYF